MKSLATVVLVGQDLVGRKFIFARDFLDQDVETEVADLQHLPRSIGG
jgi:hypothetical protein